MTMSKSHETIKSTYCIQNDALDLQDLIVWFFLVALLNIICPPAEV